MSKQNPMNFTIKVKRIDNGFIASIENRNGVQYEERFCEDGVAIIGQVRTWIDQIFEKAAKDD